MEDDPKDSHVFEEEHADMSEFSFQPMHITTIEKEEYDEDNFWDEMEKFCLSIDAKKSVPSSKDHELQHKHIEIHAIQVAAKENLFERRVFL